MRILETVFLVFYVVASGGLFLYGMNCYVMLGLFYFGRRREREKNVRFLASPGPMAIDAAQARDWPQVTTQLPIYNERFVVDRLIRAVVRMDYPEDRHEIQVLDDSDDETVEIAARLVEHYRSRGVDIVHIRRADRTGFKAGALNHGMARAKGEFLAVFDADFVPPSDFLRRTIPFFSQDPKFAMIQTRWGHVNRDSSLLTRAQSVGIDGHFVIEQGARTWNELFMNFNGTAGVWRRTAIGDAGGWEADTLTEDLDLSYRVQLAGWRMKYLSDVVTPAEIPVDINGLKSQQHRWAKGSIQTAMKILPRVFRADVPLFRKIQAVFHLTHYFIHPLMFAGALFSLPALLAPDVGIARSIFLTTGVFLVLSALSPSILYLVSQREAYPDWKGRLWILPVLVAIGVGIAVNNTRAVVEALVGWKSDFVRTPKHGVGREDVPAVGTLPEESFPSGIAGRYRTYRTSPQLLIVLELSMAAYGFLSLYLYCAAGRWAVVPFLTLSSVGFLVVGLLSLHHGWRSQPRAARSALASAR